MKLALLMLALAALMFSAAAQPTQTKEDAARDDVGKRLEEASCNQMAVVALEAAVDPGQMERQDWNLKRAEAYQELAELGQSCAAVP